MKKVGTIDIYLSHPSNNICLIDQLEAIHTQQRMELISLNESARTLERQRQTAIDRAEQVRQAASHRIEQEEQAAYERVFAAHQAITDIVASKCQYVTI